MASARTAQLYEQRKALSGLNFGSKRRVLSPANNAIASIAKKTAQNELDVNVRKYNEGMIGNEEMRSFLSKMLTNPGLSDADKQEVQMQLNDFDSRIQKDQFETAFKSAPENSIAQVQAIQSLINYHNSRASGMAAGTPAQAQALQNAAVWQQKLADVNKNMATIQQRNLRYTKEQEINQLPTNSAERAYAKSQMYKALYEQAVSTGDTVDANKYASYYQQELTNAEELAVREDDRQNRDSIQAEKSEITNILNTLANDYHDGRIDERAYLDYLSQIAPRIDALNDGSLNRSFDRTVDTVYKNEQKGGINRGTTASGLPVTIKGKGGKGTGGAQTDWDMDDFNYSDNLKFLNEKLKKGEISGGQFSEAMADLVTVRSQDVEKRIETIHAIASENPNTKILYNGKKQRAEDILNDLYTEQESVQGQFDAVQSGNFGIVMTSPSEFNTAGNVKVKGKSQAGFQIVDMRNIPQGQYIQDSEGVFHKILKEKIGLTPQQMAEVVNNVYTDTSGKSYFVKTDSSGNPFIEAGGQYVDIYDPGSANKKTVKLQGQKDVLSFADQNKQDEVNRLTKELASLDKMAAERNKPKIQKTVQPQESSLLEQAKQAGTKTAEGIAPIAKTILPQPPKSISEAISPALDVASKVIAPIMPKPQEVPEVSAPANKLNLPQTKIPEIQVPKLEYTQSANTMPVQPKLTMPSPKPNALQQAAKQQGLKVSIPKETQAFKQAKNVTVQSNPQKAIADNIVKFVKGIGTSIFKR